MARGYRYFEAIEKNAVLFGVLTLVMVSLGGLAEITLPDGERAGQVARTTLLPLRMDGRRLAVRSDPPRLGQHTEPLLQGLGYDAGQIQALLEAKAVV